MNIIEQLEKEQAAALAKKRLREVERERVREVFSRFVPEHVVDDVLERTDEDLRLGGTRGRGRWSRGAQRRRRWRVEGRAALQGASAQGL